jgi:molybdenum cofactor guanylyltransferase
VALLGAIIAGGQSIRFGADKGAALLSGTPLIDHVAKGLHAQVDSLVIVGRDWNGLTRVDDRPGPKLGPLGGISGALHYADEHGFDAVATMACDALPVPDFLPLITAHRVTGQAVYVAEHYLIGIWPTALKASLDAHLSVPEDRSMRHWIHACQAVPKSIGQPVFNVNTPQALREFERILLS